MDAVISVLFNKSVQNVLKLLLALGILFGIVGLIYYAHQKADVELNQFSKEQKKEDASEAITIDNYELKEVDAENALHWKLSAKKGVLEPNTKDVKLVDVEVNYYKEKKVGMHLQAPVGTANELTRIIVLNSLGDKKVRVNGDEKQAQIETSKLELTKNNQFLATGGVNIVMPGVAKVSGKTAEGKFTQTNLDSFVIRGNTHATIDI